MYLHNLNPRITMKKKALPLTLALAALALLPACATVERDGTVRTSTVTTESSSVSLAPTTATQTTVRSY